MENHLVYCLKCREHTHNNEIDVMPSKTNKKLLMLKSKCGQCGRGKNKWISRPHPQNGEGLQDIIDGIRRFFSGPRRDKAPPSVRKILETEGNQKIVSLSVNRDPINSVLKKIVDLVSLKMPHDKLFHLYIILVKILCNYTLIPASLSSLYLEPQELKVHLSAYKGFSSGSPGLSGLSWPRVRGLEPV